MQGPPLWFVVMPDQVSRFIATRTSPLDHQTLNLPRLSPLRRRVHASTLRSILTRNICPLNQIAQSRNMMVRSRHDHRPGRRTSRRSMEVCEAQSILGELVDVGSVYLTPEAADV